MVPANLLPLQLPIFAGQGTSAANASQTRQQALLDASSPSGSLLLAACHEAFHSELSSLSDLEHMEVQVDLEDFRTRETLLSLPNDQYLHNAAISGPTLFLLQSLRYLAFIEANGISSGSLTPFSDALKANLEHNLGILGFSSGILSACVAGTSTSTIRYISRAIEAYRLALWIGIRSQIYRTEALKAESLDLETNLPWGIVFIGMDSVYAEAAILEFSKRHETRSLYITAIIDDTCVTISGRPDILSTFAAEIAAKTSFVAHKTGLDTLYHAPIHANSTRAKVLADAASRNIQFPNFSDIKVPIRSTLTGNNITKDEVTGSLIELVIDMVLTQPVNWNLLIQKVVDSSSDHTPIQLLNVGPGAGLTRGIERRFPPGTVSIADLTVADGNTHQHTKVKQEPIAIIGMAVNMPGAPNTSKLWEVLEKGINTISEIPEHRFKISNYHDGQNTKRTMKAHTGNFIDGVDEFDNRFFKISPREAKSMDPQQRILLHTAYEALEDSGYVPESTPTSRPETFGCYIGVATHDYLQNLRENIDVYYSPGTLKAFLSGRISYAMQLSGPSIVVDTACSSSNVALYQGARALMNRDCDQALVGGVNVISSPDMFLGLDRGHFLSPTGQCKAFDASADGYSRSEGCGIFVLKRLSDAITENDHILGVIRGIEVNQSGLSESITRPHAPTQADLFKRVLENSGLDASRVNVVEAHGTGTQAGDPSELESIRSVFAHQRAPENPLHITSVKSNIGHLEAASGAAGLAKLLLMMQNKVIPRQISLKMLNPRIAPLESDNTVIDIVHAPWVASHTGMTRVALLNNFGAAGSNTALLVEEHLRPQSVPEIPGMHYVFGLSAKDDVALEALRSKYLEFLQGAENILISDIAYTSTARRQIFDHRLAVSTNSIGDLVQKLRKVLAVQAVPKMGRVVFIFSGQGGQYLGMGRNLYRSTPLFRQHVDECHNLLTRAGFPGVRQIIDANEDAQSSGLSSLEEFEAYQSAIFSLQYALAKLWISWGITPAAVVGHSLGEYAALVFAKVMSLKDALLIVANRARFMVRSCALKSTGMIAVNMGSTDVEKALRASKGFSTLSISCYNSPIDCVVSGPLSQLSTFKDYLDTEVRCKNILLTVPFGYHSPAMNSFLEDLTTFAKRVTLHAPSIPIVSNVLGELVSPGDNSVFDSAYFSRHCAEPVQFDKGIQAINTNSSFGAVDAWIEIGPHATTLPMLKSNGSLPRGSSLLSSLRRQQDPWATLTASLVQLYNLGVDINWRKVFTHIKDLTCVSLPSYPFVKNKFWVAFQENRLARDSDSTQVGRPAAILSTGYAMLHAWAQYPSKDNNSIAVFETPIKNLAGSIRGHSVGGMPLCPASVYIEQVLSGVSLACKCLGITLANNHAVLRQLEFAKPLVYDESVERIVITTITVQDGFGTFSISSRLHPSAEESVHAHGEYRLQSSLQTATKFSRALPMISRRMEAIIHPANGRHPETFSTRTAYEVIFPRVVDYAKEYRTMQTLTVDASGMEGRAEVSLPPDYDRGKFVAHPVFIDTLLHVAGFVANMQGGPNDAYICSEVGSVKVLPNLVQNDASYLVYCTNAWIPEDAVMISDSYAVLATQPRTIVAHLKGMHFRRVRLDRLKRSLVHAVGKTLLPTPSSPSSRLMPTTSPRPAPLQDYTFQAQSPNDQNSIAQDIIDIISQTCDLNETSLDLDTDLASLGVDSLMSIEIFGKLGHAFPDADVSSHALSFCKNVADIISEVTRKLGRGNPGGNETPFSLSSSVSSPRTLVTDETLLEPSHLAVDGNPDVKQVLASVLDISATEIEDDLDFESLGLDSLTSIEALHALKTEFGLNLPNNFFVTFHTARAVQSYLASHLRSTSKVMEPTHAIRSDITIIASQTTKTSAGDLISSLRLNTVPVCIQNSDSGRLPLFLLHDGSGLVNYYDRISPMGRPTWGIHNPHFMTSQPWHGVVEMAKSYADHIVNVTKSAIILGGWSFGGVAAYEVARQLRRMGVHVQGILLIDSPSPVNHVPLSDSLIDSVIDTRGSNSELRRLVKAQFSMSASMLGQYNPGTLGTNCPPLVLLRSREAFKPSNVLNVPSWLANRTDPKQAAAGWETLSGAPVKVIDIPGDHFHPFHQSNIHEVSLRMVEGCDHLERLK